MPALPCLALPWRLPQKRGCYRLLSPVLLLLVLLCTQDVANAAQGLVWLNVKTAADWRLLARAAIAKGPSMEPQAVASILSTFVTAGLLGRQHPGSGAGGAAAGMPPQGRAGGAGSSRAGVGAKSAAVTAGGPVLNAEVAEQLVGALGARSVATVQEASGRNLANVLWALGKVDVLWSRAQRGTGAGPPAAHKDTVALRLLRELAGAALPVLPGRVWQCTATDLSRMCWALAHAGVSEPRLARALAGHIPAVAGEEGLRGDLVTLPLHD